MAKRFNLAELVPEMKVSESDTKRIEMIPISEIRANPKNFYSMTNIQELADSIELNGLLEPLCVFKRDGYMLFSGHRRFQALRFLHEKNNFTKWKEIPCIVYADPHDEDRETVMLIHANSTGRVLSAYETSQQAKRLKEALVNMKKNGAELPGKIRDMVAEEMDVSATKLARLSAIENRLEDCWQESWRQGLLGESVAYEVIRLDSPGQQNLHDWWTVVCGRRISDLKMSDVKRFRDRMIEKPETAAAGSIPSVTAEGGDSSPRAQGEPANESEPPKGAVCCGECRFFDAAAHACDNYESMYNGVSPADYCSRGEQQDGTRSEAAEFAEAPAWHRCHAVEPPEGVPLGIFSGNGWLDLAIYRDGQFWYWEDETINVEVKSSQFWAVLPDLPKE